jgi:lysophospholipase L1-like esterase
VKKLLLALSSLLVCLLCADVALQVRRAWRDRLKDELPDPVLHHKWAPSRTTSDRARSIAYPLTINAQSWVETYDVIREKPPRVCRIFYVGDSTVQGVVAPEHKMVELVEKGLNAAGAEVRYEVVNTGTSSYSFLLYYLLIKTQLLEYDPDLVVINIDMTDVVNDYVYRKSVMTQDGEIVGVRPPEEDFRFRYATTPEGVVSRHELPWLRQWFVRHSGLAYYLERLAERKQWQQIKTGLNLDESANWLKQEWTPEIRRNVDQSLSVLADTIRLLKKHQVKVLVTGVPHYGQYTGTLSAQPHAALNQVAEAEGVPYLNSYNALEGVIKGSRQSDYYWAEDPSHFNIEGNRIWAEAQLGFLLDPANGLLSQP